MTSWKDIDSPQYKELTTITRSLHLSQAVKSYSKERLASHKIVSKTVDLNVKVLWFAPTRPMNENNMYGNVSFTLDWKRALEELGPYLYHVDQNKNSNFHYSRALLTNKEYEFLFPVDDGRHGMPMLQSGNKYYAATASKGVQYVLEIGVEVDRHGEEWLYKNCKIEANNHSSANTLLYEGGPYNPCICHKFNYFNMKCPSPYEQKQTKKILKKRCPRMLCDEPTRNSTRTRAKKKTRKQVAAVTAVPAPAARQQVAALTAVPAPAARKQVAAVTAVPAPAARKQVAAVTVVPAPAASKQVAAVAAVPAPAARKQVATVTVVPAPAAASRKQVVMVDAKDYYDDYYKEWYQANYSYTRDDSYTRCNDPKPKKGSDDGLGTGQKMVVGALVVALFWYGLALWRRPAAKLPPGGSRSYHLDTIIFT